MYIGYTSKRRHRPDILGPELAPSMVFTNWTAGNSATLSNDASGNLKVSYGGAQSPFGSVNITVAAAGIYRIKINSVADGVAVLPHIQISTSPGNGALGEFDFRNSVATDAAGNVDVVVLAPGTTLTITCACFTNSANYALFFGLSVRQISTLTHAATSTMRDDLLTLNGYSAANSTLALAGVFTSSNNPKDNAIAITNVGAAFGEARRINKIPVVTGRSYKFSALWIPHSVGSGTIHIGSTAGGFQHGFKRLSYNLDSTDPVYPPFFTPASGLRWNFTNTNDGWVSTNITPTNNATYISLLSTTGDPQFSKTGLSFSGLSNRYVATRITQKTGPWANELGLLYSTAGHGFSGSYYGSAIVATLVVDQATIIVWDMWQLTAGGTDWKDNTITGLRIDYTSGNAVTWQVDWIAVGNLNPLEITFTPATGDCYIDLQNSSESNALSYYILPHCDQIDSTYTLSQTGVETRDPVDEYIVNETRTIAGVSYGLYDRMDEGWLIVSDKIDDAAKADWDEFFASCAALETFRFDPTATTDTTTTKTCELVPGSQKLTRISKVGLWRAQFKVRVAA